MIHTKIDFENIDVMRAESNLLFLVTEELTRLENQRVRHAISSIKSDRAIVPSLELEIEDLKKAKSVLINIFTLYKLRNGMTANVN